MVGFFIIKGGEMAQNILTEELENTLNSIIIPDLEKMYLKEYNTDEDVLNALNEIEEKWKTLILPEEYEKALEMLCSQKYKKEEIYAFMPYLYTYIFTMKLITYLFFKGSKFDSEISLISSLNQICLDISKNKETAEYIIEHINYVQDIAMAKDEEKENLIRQALEENAESFKNHI